MSHAAGPACHEHRPRECTIDDEPDVQIPLDIERFLDQQPSDPAPRGPVCAVTSVHAEHGFRRAFGFGGVGHHLDAPALSASPRVDLRP